MWKLVERLPIISMLFIYILFTNGTWYTVCWVKSLCPDTEWLWCTGGVDIRAYTFLTSSLGGDVWSVSQPGCFIPRKRDLDIHGIGGWSWLQSGSGHGDEGKNLAVQSITNPLTDQVIIALCIVSANVILIH